MPQMSPISWIITISLLLTGYLLYSAMSSKVEKEGQVTQVAVKSNKKTWSW